MYTNIDKEEEMSKNKQEKDSKENDSKYNQELAIKDTYLHTKSLDFSLPSQGQEQNIEANINVIIIQIEVVTDLLSISFKHIQLAR